MAPEPVARRSGGLLTQGLLVALLLGAALLLHGCGDDRDEHPVKHVGDKPSRGDGTSTPTSEAPGQVPSPRTEPTTSTTTTTTTEPTTSTTTTTTTTSERFGSYLVLGDWGWDPIVHGDVNSIACQQAIADAMDDKMRELGDVKFVVNVGDSFYPNGVTSKNDPQWQLKWRDVYSPLVRSVPWYSVYGNHDIHMDPCACADDVTECAQVNGDTSNLDYFFMPNVSFFAEHFDMDLEVLALDMNDLWEANTCRWTPCPAKCAQNLQTRMSAAFDLFNERMNQTQAKNMVVFSHYPTDYFWGYPEFLDRLANNSFQNLAFFGGHRHNVDTRSCTSIAPNAAWLSGGGGGWGCEGYGDEQGFVVGEMGKDGSMTTYPVLVDFSVCCDRAHSGGGGHR